jgi:heme exporter protein A
MCTILASYINSLNRLILMLEVADLECVRGDRRLFTNLSFSLERGELLYLYGHNGCGKTTLMRAICGLFHPSEGDILWEGEPIHELSEEYTRELVYIGHKNGIKDDLTALENLRILSTLDGVHLTEDQAWEALDRIGLRGFEDLPTQVLSQGQKRRVSLARLLTHQARFWVLDEPFTALDKQAVALLQEVIREHVDAGGMALLTTHQEVKLTQGQVKQLQLGGEGRTDV